MLNSQEVILTFALIGVLGGWMMGRIGSWFSRRGDTRRADDANYRIRSLEADLRVTQRKAEEAELGLERHREEIERLRRELQLKTEELAAGREKVQRLRQSLAEECEKTKSLREELAERAEETIRASVRVKDAETELSVAQAGSEAVLDQIRRLAAERDELTGQLRVLEAQMADRAAPSKVSQLALREPKER